MMRTMSSIKEATKRDKNFPDQSIATKTGKNEQLNRLKKKKKKKSTAMAYEVQEGLSKDLNLLKFKMILFF